MAKAKNTGSVVNMSLLANIASGNVNYISRDEGEPLLNHNPPLIGVDTTQIDANQNARVWLTDAGKAVLPNGSVAKAEVAKADPPNYAIINGAVLPTKVRKGRNGGGGAPTIYPWAQLEVGATFFVGVSEKPDPVKSMTSAVSSANMKYSEEVGEAKEKVRTKRGPGNKAVIGADGKPERETVMRRDRKQLRKFDLAAVKKGVAYGTWTAPEDGVLIARVL